MPDQYSVVVENDITQWADEKGERYHFPHRYARLLPRGARLLHYKGRMRAQEFAARRLSDQPHYFAMSIAGGQTPDLESEKGDMFLEILDYRQFDRPVLAKLDGEFLEFIPENRQSNFWRDGARGARRDLFDKVAEIAGLTVIEAGSDASDPRDLSPEEEGRRRRIVSIRIERNRRLRAKALALHGSACFACNVELSEIYGEVAQGYIHIHHLRPVAALTGPTLVDPRTDLAPLCPNCHAIAHLGGAFRSIPELRELITAAKAQTAVRTVR
ncbi:MAG: restriction endonuclease [Pseudaminobacter sp.]|nr:restriction endonuclease [Pseudaminobacter sp.]